MRQETYTHTLEWCVLHGSKIQGITGRCPSNKGEPIMAEWHNNKSPNPFNWEPALFFAVWLILMMFLIPWALS